MKLTHPYSKYGLALVMLEEELDSVDRITHQMLKKHLMIGLGHFRLRPTDLVPHKRNIHFDYINFNELSENTKLIQSAGLAAKSVYLSPNIISSDSAAKQAWGGTTKLIKSLEKEESFYKNSTLTMSIAPVTSKINNGKLSQSNPKSSFLEACFCAITNTTPYKPCLTVKLVPTAIIPDLPLKKLIDFVELFKRMLQSRTINLLTTRLSQKKVNEEVTKINRPSIFNGNYPFAPMSSVFGSIGLLASIGRWAEEAELKEWADKVLDSLKKVPIYIISYNGVQVVSYNHYIVELAKENQLDRIIRGLEFTTLYGEPKKTFDSPKQQQFSLFSSRFLQLFNPPAFRDFLAFRAEYKPEILILLQTYFGDVMNIPSDIIQSSITLGLWLNRIAYFVALNEVENTDKQNKLSKEKKDDKIRQLKAKTLVELESAALSAKTETALISQVVARAGRLSKSDVPAEAKRFMEATISGQVPFDDARNLLIAFSRVRGE